MGKENIMNRVQSFFGSAFAFLFTAFILLLFLLGFIIGLYYLFLILVEFAKDNYVQIINRDLTFAFLLYIATLVFLVVIIIGIRYYYKSKYEKSLLDETNEYNKERNDFQNTTSTTIKKSPRSATFNDLRKVGTRVVRENEDGNLQQGFVNARPFGGKVEIVWEDGRFGQAEEYTEAELALANVRTAVSQSIHEYASTIKE